MQINRYTKAVIVPRQTPNLVDEGAIARAGAVAGGLAEVVGFASDEMEKFRLADEKTKVNQASIDFQKESFDLNQSMRDQYKGNPKGYSTAYSEAQAELKQKYSDSLESREAKEAFGLSADRLNLSYYQQNVGWQKQRSAAIYGERVKDAADKNAVLAYRAAQSGETIDQFLKNADANAVASSGVVSPERVANVREESRSAAVTSYIQGLIDNDNLVAAEAMVNSGKYDQDLGVSKISSLSNSIEKELKKVRELNAIASGSILADPSNKDHRTAVDHRFVKNGLADGILELSAQSANDAVMMVKDYSIVPESLQGTLRGYMSNGDAAQKEYAYSIISDISAVSPQSLKGVAGFTDSEIKDAAAFNAVVRAGGNSQMALNMIRDSRDPVTSEIRDLRAKRADELLKDVDSGNVTELFDEGLFDREPGIASMSSDEAVSRYKRIYREAFLQYNNQEAATKAAEAALKSDMGVTRAGGKKVLMAYPPEGYYRPNGMQDEQFYEVINDEIYQAVTDNMDIDASDYVVEKAGVLGVGGVSQAGRIGDISEKDIKENILKDVNLISVPYNKNRVQVGKKPAYYLFSEGRADYVRDERNQPVIMRFDNEKIEGTYNAFKGKKKAVSDELRTREDLGRDIEESRKQMKGMIR